jgi:wobble nucleotide-excising tRNase
MSGLKAINILFGTNGTGKTTISRIIHDPSAFDGCGVTWRNDRALEAHVYNRDFVERNYSPRLKGIFTLGEDTADALSQIERARSKVGELNEQITNLSLVLGADDNSSGKRKDLVEARVKFQEDCWLIATYHREHFRDAFKGVLNSKAKFCDRVLFEKGANKAAVNSLDDLKARAQTVFAEDVSQIDDFAIPNSEEILNLADAPVLQKRVVGKEDIDVAALIRRLNNSDWVRQGLTYVEGPGVPCPFCQKAVEDDLLVKLNAFFDEAYLADIAEIARLFDAYRSYSEDFLRAADSILASGNSFVNVEEVRPLIERVRSLLTLNQRHIERKRREPSVSVILEPINEALASLLSAFGKSQHETARHNALVENLANERNILTEEIWCYLLNDNERMIGAYMTRKGDLDAAVANITAKIAGKQADLVAAQRGLAALEQTVTSVQPTVTNINATLASFGFTSFKLKASGEREQFYLIERADGADAHSTLSEGERSFITFLYFYHLVRGSTAASGLTTDRIVVFDDPVSSLDSDVLFIVSALVNRFFKEACAGNGQIKQIFVLTHNIYFHKEVTFDIRHGGSHPPGKATFWTVRKVNGASVVSQHQKNPIKTSYHLLWDEVRSPNNATIQNVLRRILEYYFTILGGCNKQQVINHFDGQDQVACASLFSWMNDGSHNFVDDLYLVSDQETVDRQLRVFRDVFTKMNHEAHYIMMMHIKESADADGD